MKIAFCYNIKRNGTGGTETELEFDSIQTIKVISQTLKKLGHKVIEIEADEKAFEKLRKLRRKIDLVFTIAEGLRGDAREAQVALYCELLEIPYTHSSPTVCALCLDKHLTKLAVKGLGVRVPESVLVPRGKEIRSKEYVRLKFPVIIKPNGEGSSVGVFDKNVVTSVPAVLDKINRLRRNGLDRDLLVEEYIKGREFTVGLLGNGKYLKILPIIEQKFEFMPKGFNSMSGYELKWEYEDRLKDLTQAYECPAKVDRELKFEIEKTSLQIFNGLGIRDCARIDYRMDKKGRLYFLEVNTLPGINPDKKVISYYPLAARAAGIDFSQLVGEIIKAAGVRYGKVDASN